MKSITDLVPVEWQNRRVLTTAQLADFYGCSPKQIKQNYNNNVDRFIVGKHFFRLSGDALRTFKREVDNIDLAAPQLNLLYLWTERGAARHAKMLSTDKAWDVFEELEDNYFNPKPSPVIAAPAAEPLAAKRKSAAIRPEEIYRVYVLLLEDGNSKLGRTTRLCIRIGEIERKIRLSVADIYFTPLMSFEDSRLVEQCCKKIFASKHVTGEIFSADFETACAAVERFVKLVSVKPIAYKRNIATVNLKSAEKSE